MFVFTILSNRSFEELAMVLALVWGEECRLPGRGPGGHDPFAKQRFRASVPTLDQRLRKSQ